MINSISISIWDRDFTLPVEYDCYKRESVTEAQIEALNTFLSHEEWISNAKRSVEDYCKAQVMEDEDNSKKEIIFSYVKPECIFVKRDTELPRIALICKYRYDLEHGLAIVFSADGMVSVGSQDIIL